MNSSIARVISFIFNPLLILVFLPFFLVYKSTNSISTSFGWTIYTFVFLLSLALFVLYAVHRKIFTDLDVSTREQRSLLFFVLIFLGIIYLIGLLLLSGPRILFVTVISMMIGVIIAALINTRIKASLHVATISGLFVALAIGYGSFYLLLIFLIPLVAWSRIKIKRHTIKETIIGGILGSVLTLGIYGFLKIFVYT